MSDTEETAISNPSHILSKLRLIIPVGAMGILIVMVLRVPTMAPDLLIGLSITFSIIIMLVSVHILQPAHFSVSPSLRPINALFRLTLNAASTRLILLHGSEGRVPDELHAVARERIIDIVLNQNENEVKESI
jgi:flagellar biosynthesis protein FlhA